jgi:predicted dehydrogenase
MSAAKIRVGIVGAGANTRLRHIPGLREQPGVEIAAVCNSSPESTRRAAESLKIARSFEDWRKLVADPDLDAIVVGTWPDLHCEVTCAALEAGKHVLTEARLARNLAEARRMLQAAEAHPDLVAQVVPSPFGLECGPAVARIIDDGFLGTLRELVVIGVDDSLWDYSRPLHWRQEREKSGNNILSLGILHETALRWTSQPVQVFAQTQTFENLRPVPDECRVGEVTIPDSVQVLTQLPEGGRGLYQFSGVNLFGPGKQIHLYGSRGTIRVVFHPDGRESVALARAGDTTLQEVAIPKDLRGGWRVEQEFIRSIQSGDAVTTNTFATGVQYMEFVEAVSLSARQNSPVALPLPA